MKIQILSSEVVDQIAAGEVVERPSYLVKELVENSLDAGSTEIIIDFALGGRFVKIIDNGSGISAEDLPKTFLRFATSKIYEIEDLWRLQSFGFRGEALASISSVSQMTMFSSDNESGSGQRITCQFGKVSNLEPVSRSRGTTVIVEELFQNMPARLKFMKSESAEATQIKSVIKAVAISRPDVSFRLLQENKLLNFWPQKKNWKDRVEDVLGVLPLYEGTAVRGSVRCRSFFASPDETVKTSRMIWLFAQGRYIQDRSMQAAVMEAYRNLLMNGEFPIVASFIETEPDQIDVNIHPTKSQVKFLSSQDAFRAVQASVRDVLEKAPWLEVQKGTWTNFTYSDDKEKNCVHLSPTGGAGVGAGNEMAGAVTMVGADGGMTIAATTTATPVTVVTTGVAASTLVTTDPANLGVKSKPGVPQPRNLNFEDPAFSTTLFRKREFTAVNPSDEVKLKLTELEKIKDSNNETTENQVSEKRRFWSLLDVIGQAGLTYIVCQSQKSLVLVDQHAAHERVVFERLMNSLKAGGLEVQNFLFPLAIDLSEEKMEALGSCKKDLAQMGIELEELGPTTIGIKSAPVILKDQVVVREIHRFAQEVVDRGVSFSFEKIIADFCASMACHSVVRAGQSLSLIEMQKLLEEMDEFPLSCYCPHGRPVSIEMPWVKLEKDFGRIVT
jgi:DNA mismatch repair protein MutL